MISNVFSALLLTALTFNAIAAEPWSALNAAAAIADPVAQRTALEAVLIDHPGFQAAHFNLGTLLMDTDADAASKHLESASGAAQPELAADARFNLALLRYKQGRLAEAVTNADAALKIRSDHAESKQLLDELRRVMLVRQDEARRKAEEEAKKLHLGETTLPEGTVGELYDHTIVALGGAGSYRFSVGTKPAPAQAPAAATAPSGIHPLAAPAQAPANAPAQPPAQVPAEPPPGLVLDPSGRLHGTPTKAGSFDLPLVIEDGKKARITGNVTLTVAPPPTIRTTELPEAVQDIGYLAELSCSGLADPKWEISGLPDGLQVTPDHGPTATISGTPRTSGKLDLRIRAYDGKRQATSTLPLLIDPVFAPETRQLAPATAWAAYDAGVGIRGPVQTYRWSGAAKNGLTVQENGHFTGKPEQAGACAPMALR